MKKILLCVVIILLLISCSNNKTVSNNINAEIDNKIAKQGKISLEEVKNIINTHLETKKHKKGEISMIGWIIIGSILGIFGLWFLFGINIIAEWDRGLVFTLGKYSRDLGPGLHWVLAGFQTVERVDIRVLTIDVQPQDCITSDSVTVKVDAVIYFQVKDPKKAIIDVEDFHTASYKLAQTALRDVVGRKSLDEILKLKDEIGEEIQKIIQAPTDNWGIHVSNVEIKDVELPEDMRRAMAKEAEAIREKRSRLIKANGELEASRKLKEASQLLDDKAIILRQLQTWQEIGAEQNSMIILVPNDLISTIKSNKNNK